MYLFFFFTGYCLSTPSRLYSIFSMVEEIKPDQNRLSLLEAGKPQLFPQDKAGTDAELEYIEED